MSALRRNCRLPWCFLTLIALAAGLVAPRVSAAECPQPDTILQELNCVLRTGAPLGACTYEHYIRWDFNQWKNDPSQNLYPGSQNLPVVAAATALHHNPNQPSGHMSLWWKTYLEAQLGDRTTYPAGYPVSGSMHADVIRFHGSEAFSSTYDWSVVTSVLAVHNWARKSTHANAPAVKSLARRFLRATWWAYGLSTGQRSAAVGYKNRVLHTSTLQRSTSGFFYEGPFLALAGSRMNSTRWGSDNRGILFTRAMNLPFQGTVQDRESVGQKGVRTYLETDWPAGAETVYGFNGTDQFNAQQLAFNKVVPTASLNADMVNIRTRSTFDFVALTGFTASCINVANNGNGEATFAVAYFDQPNLGTVAREAQFLQTNLSGGQGSCQLDLPGRKIRVYDGGVMKSWIDIPAGGVIYHFRLSPAGLQRLL